jgi:hypothetical protein
MAHPYHSTIYLSVLAAAGFGGVISVPGSVFTSRNTVTTEELDRKLKPITDELTEMDKRLTEVDKRLTGMDKRLNEVQRTLNKKTRWFLA